MPNVNGTSKTSHVEWIGGNWILTESLEAEVVLAIDPFIIGSNLQMDTNAIEIVDRFMYVAVNAKHIVNNNMNLACMIVTCSVFNLLHC